LSSAFLTTFPLLSLKVILGFRSRFFDWPLQSKTTLEEIPVASSVASVTEAPSIKSTKLTIPSVSEITGKVYGSHSQIFWPFLTGWSGFAKSLDPYGILYIATLVPFFSIIISVFLPMTINSFLESSIKFWLETFNTPSDGAVIDDSCLIWAVPPTWNVLIVSCVPGSPIDWAAIIPTHSPIDTNLPLAKSLP